jgi:hypothetical protein
MIAEAPSPSCVGSNSPFLSHIRGVRSFLTDRFHPSSVWDGGHRPVQVTGVGYFDFLHGQSGVAPNGIEPHPILAIKVGSAGSGTSPPPPPPKTTPKPSGGGSFFVNASVTPSPIHYGQHASLTAHSVTWASCTASVVYSTGRHPVSFSGASQTVGASGAVSWSWHMESKGSGGTGTVTCTYRGSTKSATASFTIG